VVEEKKEEQVETSRELEKQKDVPTVRPSLVQPQNLLLTNPFKISDSKPKNETASSSSFDTRPSVQQKLQFQIASYLSPFRQNAAQEGQQ
jgi:hypothetical protein